MGTDGRAAAPPHWFEDYVEGSVWTFGRIVVDRLSTGFSEATTRLMIQLELVGLSRLGPSPLQLLKDNITGYQLLRDRRSTATNLPFYD